jgi:hypothetical protein
MMKADHSLLMLAFPQRRGSNKWWLLTMAGWMVSAVVMLAMTREGAARALINPQQANALDIRKKELEVAKLRKDLEEWPGWLTGAFGLSIGVAGTLVSIWGTRLARHDSLDLSIHDQRLVLYPALVKETELFAIYFPVLHANADCIGPKECQKMGQAISRWYFQKGGLLLSTKAREAHLNLSTALARASQVETLRTPLRGEYAVWITRNKLDAYQRDLQAVHGLNLADGEGWQFGEAHAEGEPAELRFKDFVFLQGLSSQLRTCLTEDLRGRLRPD